MDAKVLRRLFPRPRNPATATPTRSFAGARAKPERTEGSPAAATEPRAAERMNARRSMMRPPALILGDGAPGIQRLSLHSRRCISAGSSGHQVALEAAARVPRIDPAIPWRRRKKYGF